MTQSISPCPSCTEDYYLLVVANLTSKNVTSFFNCIFKNFAHYFSNTDFISYNMLNAYYMPRMGYGLSIKYQYLNHTLDKKRKLGLEQIFVHLCS